MSTLKNKQNKLAHMNYANGLMSQSEYYALLVTPASHDICELLLDIGSGIVDSASALSRLVRESVKRLES